MSELDPVERAYANMLGTAVGEDLAWSIAKIRARVTSIRKLDTMPNIEPGTGSLVANTYIDMVIREIEELRP